MHRYYVTTPIYYINDVPHLGTAYTTVAADVFSRYRRLCGDAAFFLTGTDEHGLKIERAAREAGLEPRAFCDKMSAPFRDAWGELRCEFDHFVRTTDAEHEACVGQMWRRIRDKGDLYLGSYGGWYCVPCETYYTEKDLQPGNVCPIHKRPTERIEESTYFFRLSAYAERLLALYERRPDFVLPSSRLNEVVSFVRGGLEDLSVSRTSFNWGIRVPDDPAHVMYVWFDALFSYFSPVQGDAKAGYWPPNLQLVGKDILRFHAVYWPAFLMSLGMSDAELPRHIFAHGFLTFNGQKMSKTLRNTVSPLALAGMFGVDTIRYYLMRAIAFGQDGDFNIDELVTRFNSDLGNDLGNLLNRVLAQCGKVVASGAALGEPQAIDLALLAEVEQTVAACTDEFAAVQPHRALARLWTLVSDCNTYLERAAPWTSIKHGDSPRAGRILVTAMEALDVISRLLWPTMPGTADAIRSQLGLGAIVPQLGLDQWSAPTPRRQSCGPIGQASPLFPRIDAERKAQILDGLGMPSEQAPTTTTKASKKPAEAAAPAESAPAVDFEAFAALDIRVGLVKEAARVPNKDRLLLLKIDLGEGRERQIVAGIAQSNEPADLLGKNVLVLANLKPRAFGKLTSEGMLLAASAGERTLPVFMPPDVPVGTRVK